MEKGNQPVSDSSQQGLDRCIPCCITLQKDMAMTDPYLKIAAKAIETAKQEMSAIVDPQTKVVATVPKVQVNIPAPKLYGSTSTQTKSVEVFATTAKIDTMDTKKLFWDTLNGRLNHLTAWDKAITAMEDAVKEAQAAWNHIYPVLQPVIEAMTKWMGKDHAIVAQFAGKSNTLSSYTEVCYTTSILNAVPILFLKKCNHYSLQGSGINFIEYVKNRVADLDTFEKLRSRAELNTSRLHQVVEVWKKDMCGIWGTGETIVKPRSTTMEDWMGTKDQVTTAIKVIVDARQKVMARRPYTEVCFATIYISRSGYQNIGPPVHEAMIAFEKLEEAIEQIEKDATTLAEVLNGLFPANKVDPAMGKGNRQVSTLFPQGLEDCIQGCIKLQEDMVMMDPFLEISSKAIQTAQQEMSMVMASLVTATVPGVPAAKSKKVFTTTAKIGTTDTHHFLLDTPSEHLIPHLTTWAAVVEEAWNYIYPALQSVIEVMAEWMGKDKDIVARFADKLSTLSFEAGVYRVANTWYAVLTLIREKKYRDLPTGEVDFTAYAQNRTANLDDKINAVGGIEWIADNKKAWLSALVREWKRDMCGMWGTAETIVKSESTTIEAAWIRTKDQVVKASKVIVDSRQKMMARRSYTEIFTILYSLHDRLKKVIPPVLDAIVAFEKLEEEMKQIEEDVSTLAKALHGLFPVSEAASS
jgi:hypothetical protein